MKRARVECGDGVTVERGVACRMSDGCTLYSDHYYPPPHFTQPQPVLLMRQPYGRDIASTVVYAHPAWFAGQGYNVVIQDVRGRGDSEGDFYPFRHEQQDGAETIAWLLTRPECNGSVGMYGFSYQGMTQFLAAAAQPPGLRCIAPAMAAADLWAGWFYHQGALRLATTLGWGIQMLRADARRLQLDEAHTQLEAAWQSVRTQPQAAPYGAIAALSDARLPTYLHDWMSHAEPGEYWAQLDISTQLDRIQVPALHVAGWYDFYLQGTWDGFHALCKQAATQEAREHQYLLAGPWVHIPWAQRVGDADLGAEAAYDTDRLLLRWFNHWLKGSGEFVGEPRIRHFALGATTGASRWCCTTQLKPQGTHTLYLASDGRANSAKGDGRLEEAPQATAAADHFVYDPEVPVLAPGGIQALSGPFDQSGIEQGNNVLVYTTPTLQSSLHVFGAPRVTLHAATSAPAADLTAKLVRVTPQGRAEFVCVGIARSSLLFREAEYTADRVHAWTFALEPTSCRFAAGDCIRLEIAGSAFPLYDRNPSSNVPAREASPWNWARSTHTVRHDAHHPSKLELPLCPE
ncbi:MAG: CocE/NonD family hydrolase [Acidobacteriota bacterium]|nr:CocE/NonD family hydrolase [Acidobacteriota bacterium]